MKRTTKWYNWVGYEIWDGYCKTAWIFVFIPGGLVILIMLAILIKALSS